MVTVSVIIPVYKVEKYIERCVLSLMAQTLEDMEFIFVEDCSPDNTLIILKRIVSLFPNKKIKIISQQVNCGPSEARNKGLEIASGEYVGFMDSDDFIDPDMFESLYTVALKNGADVVTSDFLMCHENHSDLWKTTDWNEDKIKCLSHQITSGFGSVCHMIAKRELIREHALSFDSTIGFYEDGHFLIRLLYFASTIVRVPKAFYHYDCTNQGSICHSGLRHMDEGRLKAFSLLSEFFEKQQEIKPYEEALARMCNFSRRFLLHAREYKRFRKTLPQYNIYLLDTKWYGKKRTIKAALAIFYLGGILKSCEKIVDEIKGTFRSE
ncbi:MAG: glycosyltransferase family 2 protein [Rikenellaceae bacterium]|nr:glycosyltransferase family 2 protein [Rikenellaceae bacterium]MCC8174151.1 glycosyltransferase family 2 protein [Odoribacter sp.]